MTAPAIVRFVDDDIRNALLEFEHGNITFANVDVWWQWFFFNNLPLLIVGEPGFIIIWKQQQQQQQVIGPQ